MLTYSIACDGQNVIHRYCRRHGLQILNFVYKILQSVLPTLATYVFYSERSKRRQF